MCPPGYCQSGSGPMVTHVPKCMSYYGAIGGLVITGRAHCLPCLFDYIYILRSSYFCKI